MGASEVSIDCNSGPGKGNSGTGKVDNETALFTELWKACAGPSVTVPRENELVFYFPQGHIEQNALYRRLWAPVKHLESMHPYANPRGNYVAPPLQTNGFIFVRIRGGFHDF